MRKMEMETDMAKDGERELTFEELCEEFEHPGAEYGTLLFWSWNHVLEEGEVRRQIRLFREGGAGGFFIHAREGLLTEYMGEQWMRCVGAAVDEAKKCGLQVWLYDEDRWPSGTAAGRVCRIGRDAFRLKGLTLEVCTGRTRPGLNGEESSPAELLAAYAAELCDDDAENGTAEKASDQKKRSMKIKGARRLPTDREPELTEKETLLLARVEISGPDEWFHGDAPADLLNPEAVACFIRETHEKYQAAVGREFGRTVKGIFSDEPGLADRRASFPPGRGWMPWTWGFEACFFEKRGYDLLDAVPYLYFDGTKSRKTRHDYWRTVGECFCESYTKQIGRWCEERGIMFTGHFLQEDRLGLCTRVNGSLMPHYQYMQMPGIDWLGEQAGEYLTAKQCASAASQLGKRRTLTETYAGTGWQLSFEGQKWIGDFQYVLGINRRCLHLAFYSLEGMRKRDYPPSFHSHNGWWEKNRVIEGYFARLSLMLSRGEAVRDVLVLHPAATAWSLLGTSPYGNPVRRLERDVPDVDRLGAEFQRMLEGLCKEHYDFDLGDENLLASYGEVTEKGEFRVGRAGYRVVLIPQTDTLLRSTKELLTAFLKRGGCVIAMEPLPFLEEGEACEEPLFSGQDFPTAQSFREAAALLETVLPRRVSVSRGSFQAEDVLYQLRRTEEGYLLFLVNHNREQPAGVQVTLSPDIKGLLEEWDPLTGARRRLTGERDSVFAEICFSVRLGKADSKLYFIRKLGRLAVLGGETAITCSQPNLLVLDQCRWRMAGEELQPQMEIWEIQKIIRERLHMRPTCFNGGAQWYTWKEERCEGDGTCVELVFSFTVGRVPEKVFLLLERPEHFDIELNGGQIRKKHAGFFLDRAFQRLELPEVRPGRNEMVLRCRYTSRTELENCFLLGNFGVGSQRELTAMPKKLKTGDWTVQGLPHYCGMVTYHFRCVLSGRHEVVYFKPGDFAGVGANVCVNGRTCEIPWSCVGDIDITQAVSEGENHIDVTVYAALRNMLGPFGAPCGKEQITGSSVFQRRKQEGVYCLEPYGLMTPCEIWGV